MNFIPKPKKLTVKAGFLNKTAIDLSCKTDDERLNKAIAKLPLKKDGAKLFIHKGTGESESYTLDIEPESITITAEGARGAFYGIQTLRQIFTNGEVPCLHIEDKPDFDFRGFHQDVTRGRIPKVETIKGLIDQMAYYKLNTLELYSENVFDFKEFKNVTARTGCITAAEIKKIENYCDENFIKLIPAVATFGHLYELLIDEEYSHLRVLKDYKPTNIFWDERAYHHTLDPNMPESFELVKSILDQCMEMFSSDTVNIGCDETFDLENFKNENSGKLYTAFVKKIAEYLASKGKKVMMWSDVILDNFDLIDELPDDVTLLTWGYGKKLREKEAMDIAHLNRKQILCPGCNTWTRVVEDTEINEVNIPGMAELAKKSGAMGVLNTIWGDWGQPCCIELSMYGFLLGAEKSWSVDTVTDENFERKANALYYKNENAIKELKALSAAATAVPWWHFGAAYSNELCENGNLKVEIPTKETLKNTCADLKSLIRRVNAQEWGNAECRSEVLMAAEEVLLMTQIFADYAGCNFEHTVNTEEWLLKFRKKWLEKNKESELSQIEKMFVYMDGAAKREGSA